MRCGASRRKETWDTPFFLTENERKCMDKNRSKYLIYRVFSANTEVPKL